MLDSRLKQGNTLKDDGGPMFGRDLRETDLLECLRVDPASIGSELIGWERAVEAWKNMIHSSAFHSVVIQSDPRDQAGPILGFGASVFVRRDFADEEVANARQGLNARIIASIDAGRSVVLNGAELRAGNTHAGLDIVILCVGWVENPDPVATSELQMLMSFRFLEEHEGYRIHRMIAEATSTEEMRLLLATNVWRTVRVFDGMAPGRSPIALLVARPEDAFPVPGSVSAKLFHYHEPVLHLRDEDQELLTAALGGLTDAELSAELCLTIATVKKRWVSLFERVMETRPELFRGLDDARLEGKRGRQKRHHLLAYVRSHPEELKPVEQRRARSRNMTRGQGV